jgi:Kringle domain
MGKRNKGLYDRACVSWAAQRVYKASDFPEGDFPEGFYCRNPRGARPEPFCFIQRVERRRTEYCNLTNCRKYGICFS